MLGLIYSIVIPLFEGPDEIWHFFFINEMATTGRMPVQPAEGPDVWLRESGQPPLYHLLAAALAAPLDTSAFPDFVRFNPDHPFVTNYSESEAPNLFIHTRAENFPWSGAVLAVHLARLLSVAFGALALVGVWLVVRETVPDAPGLALLATAVTAFNPAFIYISSVVNNDTAVAALSTWVLWLSIRLAKGKTNWKAELGLGVLLGLAFLSKLSALALLGVITLALGLRFWNSFSKNKQKSAFIRVNPSAALRIYLRPFFLSGSLIVGTAVLVSGWWYVRNWRLYGDPLAWSVWLGNIGTEKATLLELIPQFQEVAVSYWEPIDGLLPHAVFVALGLLWLLALAGWLLIMWRLAKNGRTAATIHPHKTALLLTAVWFLLLYASLIRYMLILPAAEGRLLYPAAAAISTLLVVGLAASPFPLTINHFPLTILILALFSLSAATPLFAIRPYYPPSLLTESDLPPIISLDDGLVDVGMRLLGLTVVPETAVDGEPVDITLYWQADEPSPDVELLVQVWSLSGDLLYQRQAPPAKENYPPDLWQPGDIVRDPYRWHPDPDKTLAYYVTVTVLADGGPAGMLASPALFRHTAVLDPDTIPNPVSYKLGDLAELIGYELADETLTLYWRAVGETGQDYTVFTHVLDEAGNLLRQVDSPPAGNAYPTRFWQPGDVIVDVREIGEGYGRILVGLYSPVDGSRLVVVDGEGTAVPDNAILLPPPEYNE
jgi:4-amino-4-deoxy-L-arabinose transferase-like glycosyltransferase